MGAWEFKLCTKKILSWMSTAKHWLSLCLLPPSPYPPSPLAFTTLLSVSAVYVHMFLTNLFTFFYPVPALPPTLFPSDICQSVPRIHACGSVLVVSLFCSLDSTYKRDHIVLVFPLTLLSKICFPSLFSLLKWPVPVSFAFFKKN